MHCHPHQIGESMCTRYGFRGVTGVAEWRSSEVTASLQGVSGYRLSVNPRYFDDLKFDGHIFDSSIGRSDTVESYEIDALQILIPLFEKIYGKSGLERPDV